MTKNRLIPRIPPELIPPTSQYWRPADKGTAPTTMIKDLQDLYLRVAQLNAQHKDTTVKLSVVSQKADLTYLSTTNLMDKVGYANAEIEALKKSNEALTLAYNKAIEVINDLSARLLALEKNYDPTIID